MFLEFRWKMKCILLPHLTLTTTIVCCFLYLDIINHITILLRISLSLNRYYFIIFVKDMAYVFCEVGIGLFNNLYVHIVFKNSYADSGARAV